MRVHAGVVAVVFLCRLHSTQTVLEDEWVESMEPRHAKHGSTRMAETDPPRYAPVTTSDDVVNHFHCQETTSHFFQVNADILPLPKIELHHHLQQLNSDTPTIEVHRASSDGHLEVFPTLPTLPPHSSLRAPQRFAHWVATQLDMSAQHPGDKLDKEKCKNAPKMVTTLLLQAPYT